MLWISFGEKGFATLTCAQAAQRFFCAALAGYRSSLLTTALFPLHFSHSMCFTPLALLESAVLASPKDSVSSNLSTVVAVSLVNRFLWIVKQPTLRTTHGVVVT